jgi:type III secretion protein V
VNESAKLGAPKVAWGDGVLAALVVAIVGMMIVPLPTPLVDMLIAANLTFGVLLLATALYMREALSFAAFPTLILISTLYRLALNVSSTRLILLQADAGTIIEAFGRFVVRGDYAVGALVFLILTLIQFIVIARGAERVAEVGARFTLDALPGKQLAIDAELRAGSLGVDAARNARRSLQRESQFYGAMDGALKFVKGDAIAGLLITAINFVGGVSIGVIGRGLPIQQSLATYGLLTIGDGLVTQLPTLLGSTAAALVVTRVASDQKGGSLASDIASQLFADRRVLGAAAALLIALALIPGLPAWPFMLMASVCIALLLRAGRVTRAALSAEPFSPVGTSCALLQLSPKLAKRVLVRRRPSQALDAALDRASQKLGRLGVTWPAMTIAVDESLHDFSFRLAIRELPSEKRELTESDDALENLLASALEATMHNRAHELLHLEEVQRMLDALSQRAPTLVRSAVPSAVSLAALLEVLRLLVREGVSVRWLDEILQTALKHPGEAVDKLAERARATLSARICHNLFPDGNIHLLRLAPELEEALRDGLREHAGSSWLAVPPDLAREIRAAIARAARSTETPRVLVVDGGLRRHVRELCDDPTVDLPILATTELTSSVAIASSAVVSP